MKKCKIKIVFLSTVLSVALLNKAESSESHTPTNDCPKLTRKMIEENINLFTLSGTPGSATPGVTGNVQVDGKPWKIFLPHSFVDVPNEPTKKKPFVEVATDPKYADNLKISGPFRKIGPEYIQFFGQVPAGKTHVTCKYDYFSDSHPDKTVATVFLVRDEITSLEERMKKQTGN